MKKTISLEEAFGKLEKIVASLEKGQLPLKESCDLFEEGIKLSQYCEDILNKTEKKIEILLADSEGKLTAKPFGEENGE